MKPLAITQGDPAGIGPEIVAKAFRDAPADLVGCFVVGDVATLRRAAQAIVRPGVPMVPVAQIAAPADVLAVPPQTAWSGPPARRCGARWRGWSRGPCTRRPWRQRAWHFRATPSCCRPRPPRTRGYRWRKCPCA